MNYLTVFFATLALLLPSIGWTCGGFSADWKPTVIELHMANAGETISFAQRNILRITLDHPDNLEGYWQIDSGLSTLDLEYGDVASNTRGKQTNESGRWRTVILVNTVHMPANELQLSFHTPSPSLIAFFTRNVFFRLKGYPAAMC